jgi:pimeloyl-ACP methyl ester carboxylesterase
VQFHQNDRISLLAYKFPQCSALKGFASMYNGEWKPFNDFPEESFKDVASSLHAPLQYQSVNVSGHEVPYYYVPSASAPNGRTVILMSGGPIDYYAGEFSQMIDLYTRRGWAVIIPQESSRTGFGWEHFEKGLGEMGRGNLYQLLHIFQDAIKNKLISDQNQVSLYGHSYGGFVACSFALRWDELHAEAGIEKNFSLQSIIADAAWVEDSLPRIYSDRLLFPEGVDERVHIKHIMPINRTNMPLSAPLFLVHGKLDTRCSARYAKRFGEMLEESGKSVPLFWHSGAHARPKHPDYPNFLEQLMLGQEVTGEIVKLARNIGLK